MVAGDDPRLEGNPRGEGGHGHEAVRVAHNPVPGLDLRLSQVVVDAVPRVVEVPGGHRVPAQRIRREHGRGHDL